MSRLRYNRQQAVAYLRSQCDSLCAFIDSHGTLKIKVRREPDIFNALAHAIVYQQLSGKAASTIHGRFTGLFDDGLPDAAQASRLSMEQLRSVGLSRNKALAIQDLAEKSMDGGLLPARLRIHTAPRQPAMLLPSYAPTARSVTPSPSRSPNAVNEPPK